MKMLSVEKPLLQKSAEIFAGDERSQSPRSLARPWTAYRPHHMSFNLGSQHQDDCRAKQELIESMFQDFKNAPRRKKPEDLQKVVDATPRYTTEDIIRSAKNGNSFTFGACYPWSKERAQTSNRHRVKFKDLSSYRKKQGVKPYLVHKKLTKEWYETQKWI